jgi:tetratricopeptide (TPR) repeat protein
MTAGGQDTVDYELETWARTILIGSRDPSPYDKVKAYRILTRLNPRAYQEHLAKALVELSYHDGRPSSPEARLALLEEAAGAARAVPPGESRRGELVVRTLGSYQRVLYELGRRAEGLAVREEMATASRLAFAAGERGWADWGLQTWAHGLAEEGRHADAVAALTELLKITLVEDNWGACIWDRLTLTAELDAAGHTGAAITTLSTILDEDRAGLATNRTSLSRVFHTLIWHAQLLDHAGHTDDANAARHEALGLLHRLAATGEPENWGGSQFTYAGVLLAVQARDAEPHTAGRPRPALGVGPAQWSPDLRERYFDEAGITRCGAPAADRPGTLLDEARREHGLPESATLRRRLAIRTGVYGLWHHGHRFLEPALPAFHDSVETALRLHTHTPAAGRPMLIHALTDRAMILTAGHRYLDALNDYQEALALHPTT